MNRFGWLAVLLLVCALGGCAAMPGNTATSKSSPYMHDDGSDRGGGAEGGGGGVEGGGGGAMGM